MKFWLVALILFLVQSTGVSALETDLDGWYPVDTNAEPTVDGPLMQLSQHMSVQVQECFGKAGTSADMDAIKQRFENNWRISAYVPEADMSIQVSTKETAEKINPEQLEIVFFGIEAIGAPRTHGGFAYNHQWGAVFVPAMAMTSPWFCSQLMHELYHAEKHRERGARAPKPSREDWTIEEVRAVELARTVLNTHTFNRYGEKVRLHAEKYMENTSEDSFGIAISIPAEVTALFPTPTALREEGYRVAQFGFDVLFQQLNEKGVGTDANKAIAYLRFMQALGATPEQKELPRNEVGI